ncbi:Carbohydrate sulfotransferase 1 [Mizuhopecten yessoensis]|uniref:Carbohydrate sulfotransferase 1 n=1 Tax=Mizuhopecten yessoensis TaxID=6573 RepID=A0A210PZQ8_MIZYE|nr:Carbohydrate sulfotransferase 1 [Mizuhopecten yessoensis]
MLQKMLVFIVVVLTVLVSVTWLVGLNGFCYETNTHRSYKLPSPLPIPIKQNYDVLLVGYLRGGTTFAGKILGLRQGNFYIYEPFHNLSTWGYFKPGYHCSMNDERCNKYNGTDRLVLDVLRGIYHCDKMYLLHSLQMWQVLKGRGYDDDLKNPMWMEYFPECHGEVEGCVEKCVSQCSNSIARVSKVPRLSVSLAAQLLHSEPNLKIIHLLRDPRAIMNSRHSLKWATAPGVSLSLCKKMKEDYLNSDIIRKVFPGKVLTVFYEDLVTNPLETVRTMYDFAGYDFDEKESFRLNKITGMTTNDAQMSSGKRTSLQIATAWRTKINLSTVDVINQGCNDLYSLVGYPPLRNEIDLRNSSIPLRLSN